MNCIFCNIDDKKIENTILDETDNFYVLPAVGSLVDGYVLLVSKKHLSSMSLLTKKENREYEKLIKKYRKIFKSIYGHYPIIFEHGTNTLKRSASSVTHAHTHIVNHTFKDEKYIIEYLKLQKIESLQNIDNNSSYIMYMNEKGEMYISYSFKPISQMMRILIAKDLNLEETFDWKKFRYDDNMLSTINKIKDRNDNKS